MNNLKPIYIDVDGVLLAYTEAFLKFSGLASKGITYDQILDYDLTVWFNKPEDCYTAMTLFHMSDDWKNMAPLAPILSLEMLKNAGHDLHVITQLNGGPEVRLARIQALTRLYGPVFSSINFVKRGQCKKDIIDNNETYCSYIIIEDSPEILLKYEFANDSEAEVYAVVHPYNYKALAGTENIIRVSNFAEAANKILLNDAVKDAKIYD